MSCIDDILGKCVCVSEMEYSTYCFVLQQFCNQTTDFESTIKIFTVRC